jgi:enoyl-CoA hydratase/carnithine racemase
MSDIATRVEGHAGRITLTRPQALNALSYEMARAIDNALIGWADDPAVALVLVDAEGERSFCAGGDIREVYERGRQGDFLFARRFWAEEYRMNARIARYPKPFVALAQGYVMGKSRSTCCAAFRRSNQDACWSITPRSTRSG